MLGGMGVVNVSHPILFLSFSHGDETRLLYSIVPMCQAALTPFGQALAKSFGAQPPASSLARNNFQQFEHTFYIIKLRHSSLFPY